MKRFAPLALLLLLLSPARAQEQADDSTPETDPIEVRPDKDQPRGCGTDGSDLACVEETLMSAQSLCCSACVRFASPNTCVFVYHCNVTC